MVTRQADGLADEASAPLKIAKAVRPMSSASTPESILPASIGSASVSTPSSARLGAKGPRKFWKKKVVLRNVVGTPACRNRSSAAPLASKCGTLYLSWSTGIRSSSSGSSRL